MHITNGLAEQKNMTNNNQPISHQKETKFPLIKTKSGIEYAEWSNPIQLEVRPQKHGDLSDTIEKITQTKSVYKS